jgi:hypothetical protein
VLARFEDDTPGLLRLSRGRGRVYYLGARLGEESLLSLVERLLNEAGVEPIVSVVEAGGKHPRDIESRSVEHGDDVLLYVINPRNDVLTLQLQTDRSFGQIENLRTLERRAYDGEIRVRPRDTGLFRLVEASSAD